ncbi:MAG: TlpA disulfide reductase family protein [Flavobacteriales bacterium]|jgi:thiol-disulfide isomerase/thioredoxin|tara:strand:+ start:1523 stop:2002 length:480 start_codon:yes stop_codon:yes gene_type:complete
MKKLFILITFIFSLSINSQSVLPDISLNTLNGEEINIQSISSNDKIAVVSLWATWCVPCIKELDAISEYYEEWKDEVDFELYAVSTDDSRTIKRVNAMVNGKGWEYTVLLDSNNELQRALGASTIPLTLIVKNNKIVYRHSGYSAGVEFELFDKIKELK